MRLVAQPVLTKSVDASPVPVTALITVPAPSRPAEAASERGRGRRGGATGRVIGLEVPYHQTWQMHDVRHWGAAANVSIEQAAKRNKMPHASRTAGAKLPTSSASSKFPSSGVQLDKLPQPSPPHLSEFSDKLTGDQPVGLAKPGHQLFFAEPYSNGARTVFSA